MQIFEKYKGNYTFTWYHHKIAVMQEDLTASSSGEGFIARLCTKHH